MEGVVLFETQSGALVFSRAFTDAFDLRHPRSERMNLAALLFALLNFADGSMLDRDSRSREPQSRSTDTTGPSICSFGTSQERIVFAQTPSAKIVVALFTTPALDADVATSLAHRLAYNYEHGNSLENRIAVVLNQAPRLFRDALSRSIEEQVDDLLTHFAAQLGLPSASDDAAPAFVLFYFSDYLLYQKIRELADNASEDGSLSGHIAPASPTGPLGSLGFRSPLALGSPVSPRHASATAVSGDRPAGSPSRSVSTLSFRSVYTSTRSLFPVPPSRVGDTGDGGAGKRKKKKAKKNAVMDHAEPQMFQRVVHCSPPGAASSQASSQSDSVSSTDAITYVIVPFVKEVVPLFFAGKAKHKRHASAQKQAQQAGRAELKHIHWTKFPLGTSAASSGATAPATVDLSAWKHGNCLVVYPERATGASRGSSSSTAESESARLRRLRERKRTVVALFDVLEPLVQAFMIGRT